jgi:hypothetical protein
LAFLQRKLRVVKIVFSNAWDFLPGVTALNSAVTRDHSSDTARKIPFPIDQKIDYSKRSRTPAR